MSEPIEIITGCRLHFGIFAHRPETGREFGGVGVMIDTPRVRLSVRAAGSDSVDGPAEPAERVRGIVARYRRSVGDALQPPPCRVDVYEAIPPHVGLGSGTQLAMAVACGLSRLAGEESVTATELARRVGRGARSAIGVHGFECGGMLFDDGKAPGESLGSLAARIDFPAAWRFLLVTPARNEGLSGCAEREAFARLPPMPSGMTARLRQLAFERLLPAVKAKDYEATGELLYQFNCAVGEYFAPAQGGTYAHSQMRELVAAMRREGIAGVGQSSWGPTIFALLCDADSASDLAARIGADDRWRNCAVWIASANLSATPA